MWLDVTGRKIFAATGGKPFDAAKPTVVFIHGNACDHTSWAMQTRWFAYHGYSVLAVDLPGNGRSEGPMLESVEAFADWMPQLLDAAGVQQATLVGHSMGALIALETALRHPSRVSRISLLGFAFPMAVNPELQALADSGAYTVVELMNDWMIAKRNQIGSNRVPGSHLLNGSIRLIDRAPRHCLALGFRLCNAYQNGKQAVAAITAPVQILAGERDQMTPLRAARGWAKEFRNGRIDVLPGCGHMMMGERPDETLDALKSFIAG
ncbi:MAG: alpha/beta hydrolase [Ferrovibrio sp.]|uniref:alpha/beta fold hydrolase n=1 Tax=Ferrovibrio sp. TaxID=1917215 RepID=UPI00261E5A8C|nr:alpha/beta hydrolase [Ferrovibrio sp.]MCW0232383.1 alpha/beta hydrolase [Ferrovibrio sp.]